MTNIPVAFLDNPHAPDVFADGATGWYVHGGNIRITFESVRVSHTSSPGPLNRVVIGRLVMPIERAEDMAKGLLAFLEGYRGATPDAPPGAPVAQGTPTIQ